jgi:hypothetical protein
VSREDRRRALRAINRAAQRSGRVEGASVSVSCGWKTCGRPIAIDAPDIQTASAALWAHYNREHGGEQPAEPAQ